MLENLLKDLITALNNNTAAHLATASLNNTDYAESAHEKSEADNQDADYEEEEEEAPKPTKAKTSKAKTSKAKAKTPVVTLEEVKELSGEMADAGMVTVKETRAKIQGLGYNLMKEMSDDDLAELYNWLLSVKAEAEANAEDEDEEEDL